MLLVKNKRAHLDYEVLETYTAGIALQGHEVKAVKEKKANFEGAFVKILANQAYVVNLQIGRYSKQQGQADTTDDRQTRKLLLTKKELTKITRQLDEKGKTAIPLALLLEHNLVKLELAIVTGRKKYDKRQVEKTKAIQKQLRDLPRQPTNLRG